MLRNAILVIALISTVTHISAHEASVLRAGGESKQSERDKILNQLRDRYQEVVEKLNKNDPGADTVAMQKEIAELLKRLLDENDPPPPTPPASNPPPKSSASPPSAKPMNPPPMPTETTEKSNLAESKSAMGETENAAKSLDEMKKQLLKDGHWPLKLSARHREGIETAGSGRFMPRYEEMLRAYYRTIAESNRGKRDD